MKVLENNLRAVPNWNKEEQMDRKKLRKSAAAALTLIWCMMQALPVYASGNPSVVLNSAGADMKERTLLVECNMTNMDQVTNGKLRVTYDAGKLRLLENQEGNIISDSDALCEINDCLTGNKEEGEIVFAFASAEELPAEGCLAKMKFSVTDEAAVQEKVKISVSVENMAGNEGNVNAKSRDLTVTIKKDSQSGNENNGGNGEPGNNHGGNLSSSITGGGDSSDDGSGSSGKSSITGGRDSSDDGSGSSEKSSIAGSRNSSDNGSGSSGKSSIKSGRSSTESDQDSAKIKKRKSTSESGDGKEDSVSDDERRIQIKDKNVPKAGLNEDNWYWLIIPIVVLAVVFGIVYKKSRKVSRLHTFFTNN